MDAQLLKAAQKGDSDAVTQLFEQAYARARCVARSILYPNHEANVDDVVQEAMINVFNHLKDFREEAAFETWVHAIVRNAALMYLRKNNRYVVFDLTLVDNYRAGKADSPDAAYAAVELRERFDKAIKHLTRRRRRAFVGRVIDGYNAKEMAKLYGEKVTSIKQAVFHARNKVKAHMAA